MNRNKPVNMGKLTNKANSPQILSTNSSSASTTTTTTVLNISHDLKDQIAGLISIGNHCDVNIHVTKMQCHGGGGVSSGTQTEPEEEEMEIQDLPLDLSVKEVTLPAPALPSTASTSTQISTLPASACYASAALSSDSESRASETKPNEPEAENITSNTNTSGSGSNQEILTVVTTHPNPNGVSQKRSLLATLLPITVECCLDTEVASSNNSNDFNEPAPVSPATSATIKVEVVKEEEGEEFVDTDYVEGNNDNDYAWGSRFNELRQQNYPQCLFPDQDAEDLSPQPFLNLISEDRNVYRPPTPMPPSPPSPPHQHQPKNKKGRGRGRGRPHKQIQKSSKGINKPTSMFSKSKRLSMKFKKNTNGNYQIADPDPDPNPPNLSVRAIENTSFESYDKTPTIIIDNLDTARAESEIANPSSSQRNVRVVEEAKIPVYVAVGSAADVKDVVLTSDAAIASSSSVKLNTGHGPEPVKPESAEQLKSQKPRRHANPNSTPKLKNKDLVYREKNNMNVKDVASASTSDAAIASSSSLTSTLNTGHGPEPVEPAEAGHSKSQASQQQRHSNTKSTLKQKKTDLLVHRQNNNMEDKWQSPAALAMLKVLGDRFFQFFFTTTISDLVKMYTCNICQEMSRDCTTIAKILRDHIRNHYYPLKYKCKVCNIKLKNLSSVGRHNRTRLHLQNKKKQEKRLGLAAAALQRQ